MKVALVIPRAERQRGGAEGYTCRLADALLARGLDVTLVAGTFDDCGEARRLEVPRGGWTRRGRFAHFSRAAAELARGFDVVHTATPIAGADVYQPHAGFCAGHARSPSGKRRLAATLERRMIAADRPTVLTLSDAQADAARTYFGHVTTLTLRPGVDLARFDPAAVAPLGLPGDPALAPLLFVAQNFRLKGLATAIEATARVPGTRLIVVGRDRPLPAHDRVHYLGGVDRIERAYAAAGVGGVLMPTTADSFGLYVVEAAAMGVPTAVSAAAGAAEVLTSGRDGLVLPDPRDAAAWAEAARTLADPAARAPLAAGCLALRPTLAWDRHVDALVALYRTLV